MLSMCEQNDELQSCLVRYIDKLHVFFIKSVLLKNIKLAFIFYLPYV